MLDADSIEYKGRQQYHTGRDDDRLQRCAVDDVENMREITDTGHLGLVGIRNIITEKTDQYREDDQREYGLVIRIGE